MGEYTQSEARKFHPTLRLAGERGQDASATRPRGIGMGATPTTARLHIATQEHGPSHGQRHPFKVSLTRR